MGKRGRKPVPTRVLEMRGSRRAANRKGEVEAPAGRPPCPRWLPAEARKEWRRVVPILEGLGLVSPIDLGALAAYCEAWAEFRAAVEFLAGHPGYFETPQGYVAPHPMVSRRDKAAARMRTFGHLFGLSPSCRRGLAQVGESGATDELEEFLAGNGG